MSHSCWIHADFMLISCSLEIFTMLCATLCITMVLNSCWIQAVPCKIYVFYNFSSFLRNPRLYFLIVYSMNNPVKCFKCHFFGKFRYFSRFCLNSAWIQHEFDMSSTPASPQPNLHQNLGKTSNSTPNLRIIENAWIQHESDMNGNTMLHVWICMNSAWIQHEFNMNSTPCCSQKIHWNCQTFPDFLRRFGLAVWIWSQKKCFLTYFREMHESSMNPAWMDFSNILTPPTPNHQSKPPLKQIWSDFFWPFSKKTSNQIHAVFMPDSCWIHAYSDV